MRFLLLLPFLVIWINFNASAQGNKTDSLKKLLKRQSEKDRGQILEELCYQLFITSRQDSLPNYVSELSDIASKTKSNRLKALSELYKSQSYYREDTALFFQHGRKAESLAINSDCQDCLALSYLGLGLKYRNLQQYNNAIEKFAAGLAIANSETSMRFKEISCNLHIALSAVYHYKSNFTEALHHGLEASRIAEQLGDATLKQKTYNSLSAVYGELYSPDNNIGTEADRKHYKSLAKYYMIKTYKGSLMAGSKKASGVAAYNLGLFFSEEKSYDSANYFLNQSIRLGEEADYPELLGNAYNVKGGDYSTRNPDLAIYFFDKAIQYSQNAGFVSNVATAMTSKASILQQKGSLNDATLLAKQALELSKQSEEQTTTLNIYKLLSELYEQKGDHILALNYFKRHIALKDSIVSAENFARIEKLKAEYDSERKDLDIRNLSQTASIQALEIRQRNLMLISLFVFVILITTGLILYFGQRNLAQQQKQLQLENRFLRFQLNPHFLSNALVSIQRFLFDSDAQKAADFLGRFSKLMRQFLEYSRKDFIAIEDEIEALKNYLDIQKLSFSNGFNYTIYVDDQIDTALDKIPPMFAQPFVENALEHGIKGFTNGRISIKFKKQGAFVLLTIEDNGSGLKEKNYDKERQSLATTIIRERIDLLNKSSREQIELRIENNPNGAGTHVEMKLPIYS